MRKVPLSYVLSTGHSHFSLQNANAPCYFEIFGSIIGVLVAIIILLIIYIIWLHKKGELIIYFEGFSYLYFYFTDRQILSPLLGTTGKKRYDFPIMG